MFGKIKEIDCQAFAFHQYSRIALKNNGTKARDNVAKDVSEVS